MTYLIATIVFLALGLLVGRWLVVAVPAIFWTLVAVGLSNRWWGRPRGEFLVLGTALLSLVDMLAAAVGVLVRRGISRLDDPQRQPRRG
jgi:hypothetical protein